MTTLQILIEARRLIDACGHTTSLYETPEGCLCTTGALIKAYDPMVSCYGRGTGPSYTSYLGKQPILDAREKFASANDIKIDGDRFAQWLAIYRRNDISTKEEVLAMFDKAIEAVKVE